MEFWKESEGSPMVEGTCDCHADLVVFILSYRLRLYCSKLSKQIWTEGYVIHMSISIKNMEVSRNGDTPKCIVYNGKPIEIDDLGVPPWLRKLPHQKTKSFQAAPVQIGHRSWCPLGLWVTWSTGASPLPAVRMRGAWIRWICGIL